MDSSKDIYLVSGSAGFIGFHVCRKLITQGYEVIGFDNLNDYYDISLKKARNDLLFSLNESENFTFYKGDLVDKIFIKKIFKKHNPNIIINLAAQAGVRFSLTNPDVYLQSNVQGFLNIIEESRNNDIKHLVYASTSSVYGASTDMPFSEDSSTDHPIQLYAVTKKANELTAHAYSSLYNLPTTGLRFFTVYGPWGRPDMSLFLFTKNILEGKPISLFNNGDHLRSFTYIDDLVNSILTISKDPSVADKKWDPNKPNSSSSNIPFRIFNLGNPESIKLKDFVCEIEKNLNKKAIKKYLPLQKGDIRATQASNHKLEKKYGISDYTSLSDGVKSFVQWYVAYYGK